MSQIAVCLPLSGANNVRDLGGYQTNDKKITKFRSFIRADRLYRLPDQDKSLLYDYGIRTVIDLRADDETLHFPSALKDYRGVSYHHVPLIDNIHSGNMVGYIPPSLHEMYVNLLTRSSDLISRVFSLFASVQEGGILFNCTAGKDRTGIVAMLLLKLADVDEETIVEDYSVSECNNGDPKPIQEHVKAEFGIELPNYLFESKPEQMVKTLEFFQKEYHTAEDYLIDLGLTAAQIDSIKKRLIE